VINEERRNAIGAQNSTAPAAPSLEKAELGFNRRDILRGLGLVVVDLVVPSGGKAQQTTRKLVGEAPGTNWAGNVKYEGELFHPSSLGEIQNLIRGASGVKVVGGRHSFSAVANTRPEGTLLSLDSFKTISNVDRARLTVDVGAGVKYSDLCPVIARQGFTVENTASVLPINVVGASATGTHGSGTQSLAAQITGLQFVNGKGELVRLSQKDGNDFSLTVVGLGGFGVVTGVTMKVVPNFEMRQRVWEEMPFDQFLKHFDKIMKAGYSVSAFTTWRGDTVSEVWVKRRATDGDSAPGSEWYGAKPAPRDRHPIVTMDPTPCTPQMGVVRQAWEILPHFRPDKPPSSRGHERHSEYSVPEKDAVAAMRALHAVGDKIGRALQISEIRTVKEDNLALSVAYRRPSVLLHFTWTENDADVTKAIPVVEEALRPFQPRPHWGKMSHLRGAELRENFPKLDDFRKFCEKHDPAGRFRNSFLDKSVFAD